MNAARLARGLAASAPPRLSATGSLTFYLAHANAENFQPANTTFALLPALEPELRKGAKRKADRHHIQVERGLAADAPVVGSGAHPVHPKLLVTVGVLGALDFLEAIKGNPTICAVGCDPGDPIGKRAAYMVAGEVEESVKAVLAAL